MKVLINIVFIFFFISVQSQNFKLIDNKVKDYPHFDTIDQLVLRVNNTFQNDQDKVRAFYTWMAHNILYDLNKYNTVRSPDITIVFESERLNKSINNQKRVQLIKRVFKDRKALCLGLSTLFEELCLRSNIEVKILEGITKVSISDINNTQYLKNHAWNAVKIKDQWKLLDLSFSSGFEANATGQWTKQFNDFYFFTNPEQLITTHLPVNDYFQLIKNPVSVKSFFDKPVIYFKYFESGLELSDQQNGLVNVSKEDKKIRLSFKVVNKNKTLYYKFNNQTYLKKLDFIANDNNYSIAVDYKSKKAEVLSLYYENVKILDFKIVE